MFDDAVMHHHDLAGAITVRMSIFFRRTAMRRPARVADSVSAVQRLETDGFFQIAQLALGAAYLKIAAVATAGHRDARRVISAILEPPQPVYDDRHHALFPYVTNNATHNFCLLIRTPESGQRF